MQACQAGGLDPEAARVIETKVRADFGGQRVRIPKKKKHLTEEAKARAFEDGVSNMPIKEVTEKHGISRRTLYRLLKR